MSYLWLKALHVAAAITFVSGVLGVAVYLAALGAVGASSPGGPHAGGEAIVRASVVVRRWDRAVTTPAMLIVWTLGLALARQGGWFAFGWLQAKLACVLLLSGVHGMQSGALRRAAGGASPPRPALRVIGPVILGLVAAIAVLVVVKPH